MASKKSSKEKMVSRDVHRRVEVISKKTKEMGDMGVPAAFIYITPWTGGIYMTGDSRITSVLNGTSVVENLLHCLSNESEGGEDEEEKQVTGLCLPKLPAKLDNLNSRTLQSMLIAIAKDMKIDWRGVPPPYWPADIPFVNPRAKPPEYKGMF